MKFIHSPLPARTKAVRLLDLHPAYEKQAEIRCRIRDASLDDHPSYKALSYVWGNPDVTLPIIVDDRSCVWVDAVCINQKDDEEKSAQVPLMREIYSMAEEVVVWLGKSKANWTPSDDMDEDLAFGLIKDLSRFGQVIEDLNSFIDISRSTNVAELKIQWRRWQALANLFHHPWFQRLWTFQEAVVCSRATVLGLSQSIKWHEFEIAAETIHKHADKDIEWALEILHSFGTEELSSWVSCCEVAMVMPRLMAARLYDPQKKKLTAVPIIDILQITRRYFCADPRDRVFAIYGLSEDATSAEFFPDYTQTVSHVYTRCTWSIIQTTRSLSPLCLAGLQSDPYMPSAYHSLPFPSWLVDWGSNSRSQPSSLEYGLYNASLGSGPITTFQESTRTLKVYGILVDTVWKASKSPMDRVGALVGKHLNERDSRKEITATWKSAVNKEHLEEVTEDFRKKFMNEQGAASLISTIFLHKDIFHTWQEHFKAYPTECDPGHAWIRTLTFDIAREVGVSKKVRMTDKILRQIYALARTLKFLLSKC